MPKTKPDVISKKKTTKNNIIPWITQLGNAGFSYLWNSLSDCGALVISKNTFFQILKSNTEAQAWKELIVKMVWKWWFRLTKDWKPYIDKKLTERIANYFTDPISNSLRWHRDKFFTNRFAAWQVFGYRALDWLWEWRDMILDSRYVRKSTDTFWIATWYSYSASQWWTQSTYWTDKIFEKLVTYDPDYPIYWQSAFTSVVYNAFADYEANKRNFYYFKNNVSSDIVLILKDTVQNPEELKATIEQFKAQYTSMERGSPIMANTDIQDVKTLQVKNTDLQLLELWRYVVAKMWVIFQLNPKLFWWAWNEFWSYTEFEQMAMQWDDVMNAYADEYEEYINWVWKKFEDPKMDYYIEVINESFLDKTYKNKWVVDLINTWVITRLKWQELLGYYDDKAPAELWEYFVKNDVVNIKDVKDMTLNAWAGQTTKKGN